MVTYWEVYRNIIDYAYAKFPYHNMALNNTEGDWSKYNWEVHHFLNLRNEDWQETIPNKERFLGRFVGEMEEVCTIFEEEGRLLEDGLPHAWPRVPILNRSGLTFDVESLPFQITFEADPSTGQIIGFFVRGSELLEGSIKGVFRKEQE